MTVSTQGEAAEAPALDHVAVAFRELDGAESSQAVFAALVNRAAGLADLPCVLVDREDRAIASWPPGHPVPSLPQDLWEGPALQARTLMAPDGTLRAVVRLRLEAQELALVADGPWTGPHGDERLTALQLLAAYGAQRALCLLARQEAATHRARQEEAHEQQVEMALKLYDLYEEAQSQAITDGLTGLATHDFFQQRLEVELKEAQRYQKPLSFMLFDLDHFKPINDTHGHQAGDIVLKEAAAMLMASVRTTDLVARYGGEEFAVILPHTNSEDALLLADRLRQYLDDKHIPISETRSLHVTASIGVASVTGEDYTPKTLIKRADSALYAAKNGGRNRVILAQGPVVEAVSAIGAPRAGSHEMFFNLAHALSAAIEARLPMMHGHSEAVGDLASRMAKAIGLSQDKQDAMRIAGLLHDVGMLSVPESVILKPGRLDAHEWGAIKDHPAGGVAILARFSTFGGLLEAVLYHHERWDGQGYPEGLSGTAIPMGARILAICDTYDALVRGDYAYGMGVPMVEARDEIGRCAGTQFDPELVGIFLQVIEEAWAEAAR